MWPSADTVEVSVINMQSKMKILGYISVAITTLVLLSCTGNVDDSSLPVLEVSDSEIDLATETQAVFTVTYNGVDVTSESEILSPLSSLELRDNVFAPVVEGTVTFHAVYDGKTSNSVEVRVINSDVNVESKYDRHVSVIEFTGAWCINCPEGYDKMMGILSKPSLAKYRENIHICAFHSNEEGDDDMAIPATRDVFDMVEDVTGVGLAYPSFTTDLRNAGVLTADGISDFQPSLMASFNDYLPHCGVAVSSSVSGGKADVTVKVQSELTSQYRVVVLVVEDGVKGPQKTTIYPDGQSDYNHRHVVRKVATAYSGTFTGEKLTDDGTIPAGQEATKVWNVAVDEAWKLENTEIYALALDKDGYVNNMNVCAIDGGDSGYDLK